MPTGSLLKRYPLLGVINVVRRREAEESGISQNQLLESNLRKKCAPVSWASVSFILGSR